MAQDKYWRISCSEDGVYVEALDKATLEDRLAQGRDYYGQTEYYNVVPDSDPMYWDKALIIKGHIVVPKAVQQVTKYEVE